MGGEGPRRHHRLPFPACRARWPVVLMFPFLFSRSQPWMMILLRSLLTMVPVCARPVLPGTMRPVLSSHPSWVAPDIR